ncbi:MAG: gliding motility-associated C-terminal domain-containing protein [Bacteroidales bacterium]|nr:gliding motility-associated C-terminal domain-containing protein [Bacteroidales bacterium]
MNSQKINGSNIEPKLSVIDNQDNTYILCVFFDTITAPLNIISKGLRDIVLIKIDKQGNLLWVNPIGSSGAEIAGGLTLDNQNNIYVSGVFRNICYFGQNDSLTSTGNGDIFLAKYNNSGVLSWTRRIGITANLQASSDLIFDGNNRIIALGYFIDSLVLGYDIAELDTFKGSSINTNFIASLDLDGNPIWSKIIFGTNTVSRILKARISPDGYYFGGHFQGDLYFDVDTLINYPPSNNYDAFIYKTDFDGNGLWVRRIQGQNTENFRTIANDEFDNVYLLGNYNSNTIYVDSTETITKSYTRSASTNYDTYIAKYNRSGILQWFLRKGGTGRDIYNDFVLRNNIIYATGYFAGELIFNEDTLRTSSTSNEDAFLAAFNEIGDPIAGVSVEGLGDYQDAGTIVNMDASSRAYVSGYYKSPQIQIGDSIYTSNTAGKSDLFFAIYEHPLRAVITDERQVTCNGLSNGMLTATPYFGTPPYSYSWSHNTGLNNPIAEGLAAAHYTVTITDGTGKTASVTGTVSQPAPLLINGNPVNPSCYNYNNGEIDISPSGGTLPYDFTWTSPNGSGLLPDSADQKGLNRGTYILTLTDNNLCTETDTFVLTQPAPITFGGTIITENTGGDTLPNGEIDLYVSGGTSTYLYAWTYPSGSSASAEDIDSLPGGTYTIEITDAQGCESDTSLVVPDESMLIAQIKSKTDVTCNGYNDGSATVEVFNGIPPYDYVWSDGFTSSDNPNSTLTRTGLAPLVVEYTVTVTDNESKATTAKVKISEPATLGTLVNATPLRCKQDNSGVISLNVSGGTLPYSYSWLGPGGYTSTSEDLVNIASGNYAITVTDANGCTKTEPPVFVNEPINFLTADISLTKSIKCYGELSGELTANASGGTMPYKYYWNDPGAQVTKVATGLRAGSYRVTVTDNNQCITVADAYTLSQPGQIGLASVTYTRPTCVGDSDGTIDPQITFETPLYSFEWDNGHSERVLENVQAGDYSLTVTDINSCTENFSFTLKDTLPVTIQSISTTDATCFGYNDGTISITASGGTGTLSYSVLGGLFPQTSAVFDTMPANNYTVRVVDANNCVSPDSSVTIGQPAGVDFTSQVATAVTCYGDSNGAISITASGGAGELAYSIDNGLNYNNNNGLFDGLAAGNYSVRLRDTAGCEYPGDVLAVETPPAIEITGQIAENISCAGYGDGTINITATGGTGTLQYSVNKGTEYFDNNGLFTGLTEGTYPVRVRDAAGCDTAGTELEIINPDTLRIDTLSVIHVTEDVNGSVTLTSEGGTGTVDFIAVITASDSLVNVTGQFTDLQAGGYRFYAADFNHCISNSLLITLTGGGSGVTDLIIYDAFSPNGDGKNDVWNIGNISSYPDCKVKIFNAWGNTVFTSDGYSQPWDGKFNGKELPSGTYYYVIDPGNGTETLTGPVNIVK